MNLIDKIGNMKLRYPAMVWKAIADIAPISSGILNGIDIYEGRVFICDLNNYIMIYNFEGEFQEYLQQGDFCDEMEISSLKIDSERGVIWFVDTYNKKLYRYSFDDQKLMGSNFSDIKKGDSKSVGPIDIDKSGNCYVLVQDSDNLEIIRFNSDITEIQKYKLPFLPGITSLIVEQDRDSFLVLPHQEGALYRVSENSEPQKVFADENLRLHFVIKTCKGYVATIHSRFNQKVIRLNRNFGIEHVCNNDKLKDPACLKEDSDNLLLIDRYKSKLWKLVQEEE